MALKLTYYGQNDTQWSPDVTLIGDPGTDQQTLTSAGYLGGKIVSIAAPGVYTSVASVIIPCDPDGWAGGNAYNFTTGAGTVPFGTLINGPGEFAGAIGPSGSKKAPIVRAHWQGSVNSEAYDANIVSGGSRAISIGAYLYCGGHVAGSVGAAVGAGLYTSSTGASTAGLKIPVGICTHVPTTSEPWLGVASEL